MRSISYVVLVELDANKFAGFNRIDRFKTREWNFFVGAQSACVEGPFASTTKFSRRHAHSQST